MNNQATVEAMKNTSKPGTDGSILLDVQHVKKYFPIKTGVFQRTTGYIKAVDGVSFQLRKGQTLGIVGESGCGKSTVGRTIIRLYQPTEGKIIFNNRDISSLSESELRKSVRKDIQMVFQDPYASLNPRKTLGETLAAPFKAHRMYSGKQRTQVIKQLLERVGLHPSSINRYPHEFSGGQRQRIGIARALALHPQLIIADEPVSALDVSIQSQIINLMEDLQREFHLTYIFISHDLSVVRHISDQVAVMYLGRIMEFAPKAELYSEPLHPYSQALLSSVPVPRKKGMQKRERIILQGDLPNPSNPPAGCVFHTRCPAVMDRCRHVAPEYQAVKPDHYVACHLYE